MSLSQMRYYDHPEGQDAFGKMIATNKYALSAGLIWSSYDVLMATKPQGYLATIGRYAYWTGPFMGMASAFTMTTLATTKLRGKCDTWNYIAGAIASASVFGAWQRSVVAGSLMAVAFSAAAIVKKDSVDNGWEFMPEVTQRGNNTATSATKYDFTLMAERPRNWTTGRE